jgi:hypothetical protein
MRLRRVPGETLSEEGNSSIRSEAIRDVSSSSAILSDSIRRENFAFTTFNVMESCSRGKAQSFVSFTTSKTFYHPSTASSSNQALRLLPSRSLLAKPKRLTAGKIDLINLCSQHKIGLYSKHIKTPEKQSREMRNQFIKGNLMGRFIPTSFSVIKRNFYEPSFNYEHRPRECVYRK